MCATMAGWVLLCVTGLPFWQVGVIVARVLVFRVSGFQGASHVMSDARLKRAGVSGYNRPKRTPGHPTKSHVVLAREGGRSKLIRFGQQGVKGSPKSAGESRREAARRASFKARHRKNINKGKMSAAYWADKVKW